jgi:hypothetical protein
MITIPELTSQALGARRARVSYWTINVCAAFPDLHASFGP